MAELSFFSEFWFAELLESFFSAAGFFFSASSFALAGFGVGVGSALFFGVAFGVGFAVDFGEVCGEGVALGFGAMVGVGLGDGIWISLLAIVGLGAGGSGFGVLATEGAGVLLVSAAAATSLFIQTTVCKFGVAASLLPRARASTMTR